MFPEVRAKVITEARSWIGTPYHHSANIKGAGVDCAMLLREVFNAAAGLDTPDPRPYPKYWYLHHSEELFLGVVLKHAVRTETPEPGDIALYRFGRTVSHGGIIVEDDCIVHAYAPVERVEVALLRSFAYRLDSFWTIP